jgi:hypothetical protein
MSKQTSLNFIAMPPQKIGGINRNSSRSLTPQRAQPKAASNAVAFEGKNRLQWEKRNDPAFHYQPFYFYGEKERGKKKARDVRPYFG